MEREENEHTLGLLPLCRCRWRCPADTRTPISGAQKVAGAVTRIVSWGERLKLMI